MDKKLTALIVDDEKKAAVLLNKLLEDTLQFSEVRAADSAQSAAVELNDFEPDLIFLDIKMPGRDGITFLKELHLAKVTSEIVFVTAHNKFALEAVRNHAFGYLLKPVNRVELDECIQHFMRPKKKPLPFKRIDKFLEAYEGEGKLRFNTRTGYFFIDPVDILYCEADGNYSNIHTREKRHMCSLQLGVIYEMLPKNGFVRLGRSLIINFKYVASVDRKKQLIHFENQGMSVAIHVSHSQIKELEKAQEE